MIRFLLAILLFHFALISLTSCTTPTEQDEYADEMGPIEDEEVGDEVASGEEDEELDDSEVAEDEAGGEEYAEEEGDELDEPAPQETAQNEGSEEDDLESEFDNEEGGEEEQAAVDGDDDTLDDELAADDLEESPVDPPPAVTTNDVPPEETPEPAEPEIVPPPVAEVEKARVRDIRYLTNSSGGTVVIETSKPVVYQTRMNASMNQFVIEMADVELPPALQRPYQTKGFNSRIGGINAYQGSGSNTARVVIQLAGNLVGEPIVQQEGTSLVVIPPAPAPAPAQTIAERPSKPKPTGGQTDEPPALAAKTLDEFLTGNQKFYGRVISLQVKNADVRDVVNFLAEESGANIVMSDDVEGAISLKLRRIPWDQALVTVMRTKALGYVRQGNVLRISSLKALQAEAEAANKIIESQKAIVPSVVQVLPISYADLEELSKNVAPFLSKDGKVVPDKRTSTLIVTDKAEVVDRVKRLVKTLDVAPAQVSIESKIVEAVEEFDTFVGVNWGFGGNPVNLSSAGGANGAPIDLNWGLNTFTTTRDFSAAAPFSSNLSIGALDVFGDLTATLTLAERDSLAKVISSPRISSMNREKSTIRQEGENVTAVTTRSETTGTITKTEKRTPFSLELSVTPQITADGGVIMDLEVKREFLGPLLDAETGARAVNKRFAKSKILVRNGQTAVIGGIYTSDELESSNGVPGLKNIPILGWLFKSKSFARQKNELLIFMTPRILTEAVSPELAAASNPTSIE